ncbi:GSCOCG00013583001-RA-CDS, partial [Cotesia congregata]
YAPKNNSLEAKCDHQVQIFENSLQKFELWALEMFDASTKIPSGIFQGNIKDLGMYDQCLKINATVGNETIRGKHCMYTLEGNFNAKKLPVDPAMSVCLPATCSPKQVKEKMQKMMNMAEQFLGGNKIRVKNATCSEVDDQPWELGTKVTLGVLGALMTFLLICTICELLLMLTSINSSLIKTLGKFSLIVNSRRILSTKAPEENLPIIAGVKAYALALVVLGHRYFKTVFSSVVNLADIKPWWYSWKATFILSFPQYSVDTFLTITGVLTSYLFLKEMARGRKFNIFFYYFHRYFRLTPMFMALVLITTFLVPKLGSGALWQTTTTTESDSCKREWWPMLLYVHNYVYTDGLMCMGHSWYLAVDMQLFWVSPLIIYPLYKKPKVGLIILSAAIVASMISPAVVAAVNKLPATLHPKDRNDRLILLNFYILTHARAGPWLLGILLGYLLATGKRLPIPGGRKLGWILAILAFAYSFFTYTVYQKKDYKWNIYWETFQAAFARHFWAFGVCWIIYVSAVGHGGLVSKFLSLPIYLPLSRISYSIYLLHYTIQSIKLASDRVPFYFTDFKLLEFYLSDMLICIIGGFLCTLIFESPFVVLEKLIFSRKK